jgi:hypothetical protein
MMMGTTTSGSGGGSQTLPPDFLSQIAAALDHSNEQQQQQSQSQSQGSRSGFRVRSSRRRGGSSAGTEVAGGGNDEVARLLESLGLGGGPDLEEMMLQEAMRLSQLEEEERQKKVKEEEEKKVKEQQAQAQSQGGGAAAPSISDSTLRRDSIDRERELSEAMDGNLTSPSSVPTTTTFPTSSTSQSTNSVLDPIPPPSSSINTTSLTPPSSSPRSTSNNRNHDQLRTPTATSPTRSDFPSISSSSSSAAPSLPPIDSATTEFDPLGPSVSRASETSSFVVDTSGGYQQLEDESDNENNVTTEGRRTDNNRDGQSGRLIDI